MSDQKPFNDAVEHMNRGTALIRKSFPGQSVTSDTFLLFPFYLLCLGF